VDLPGRECYAQPVALCSRPQLPVLLVGALREACLEPLLLLFTGFVLGLRHAFDPDHITAITHFVSVDPTPRRGAMFGFRWGIGHTITVFVLAAFVILLKLRAEEGGAFERWAEITVGASLIALGLWRLWLLFHRPHSHAHSHGGIVHEHPHTHVPGSGHVHAHAPTLVGMIHGAAGTAGVLALVPVSVIQSQGLAFTYITVFCLGTTFAMSGYGFVAAQLYRRAGASWQRGFNALVAATAVAGLALGAIWIGRNL
jgi:ABC-type nickel/cobalt efflux system permease component RcnA